MISNIGTLILGIIKEKPLNAYEIIKLLDDIKSQYWLKVSPASVYATIKRLDNKGYVVGEVVKDGNMPDKTIYKITEEGIKEFEETLIKYLEDTELDIKKFNIFNLFICHLDKNLVIKMLEEKHGKLTRVYIKLEETINEIVNNPEVNSRYLAVLNYNKNLIKAEKITIKDLLVDVEKDNNWNNFIINSIR